MDPTELDDDLVLDMGEILTSFCARLYGNSAAENTVGHTDSSYLRRTTRPVIVRMRTTRQAEKVASLTGGVHLSSDDGSRYSQRSRDARVFDAVDGPAWAGSVLPLALSKRALRVAR